MRRAPFLFPLPRLRGRVGRGHARLSAFHHGSYRQGFRPLGAASGQASWDVAGRSILNGRPNRGAKTSRSYTGVTRARLSQSRECTSRTGRSAGQHDARSRSGADCKTAREHRTRSVFRCASRTRPLSEQFVPLVPDLGTKVKSDVTVAATRPESIPSPHPLRGESAPKAAGDRALSGLELTYHRRQSSVFFRE